MKLFQIFIVAVFLVFNFIFASPSLADRVKIPLTENPDYIEVTQTLNTLLKNQNNAPIESLSEETQKQINDLQFQKYALESGVNWGQCSNQTGKTLGIYGQKPKKSTSSYDNGLYFLADGQTTEEDWDCDGIYVPQDVQVSGLENLENPVAVKILGGTKLVAKTNPENGLIELNVAPTKVFKAGGVNWFIPSIPQEAIDTRIVNAPTEEND
jgi:hypothetical protein